MKKHGTVPHFITALALITTAGFLLESTAFALADGTVQAVSFDPPSIPPGGTFLATFSGANLMEDTYFDVRFRSPDVNEDRVVLNWQRGASVQHNLPVGTA